MRNRLKLMLGGGAALLLTVPALYLSTLLVLLCISLLSMPAFDMNRLLTGPLTSFIPLWIFCGIWFLFGRTLVYFDIRAPKALLWFQLIPAAYSLALLSPWQDRVLGHSLAAVVRTGLSILAGGLYGPLFHTHLSDEYLTVLPLLLVLSAAFCLGYRYKSIKPLLLGLLLLSVSSWLFSYPLDHLPLPLTCTVHAGLWIGFGWWFWREMRE